MVTQTIQGAVLFAVRPAAAARRRAADGFGQVTLVIIDGALRSSYADEAVRRVLESDVVERAVGMALDSPTVERIVTRIVDSPVVQDAIARIADDAVARLRGSEALWALVDDVVQSPVVADAITQQGMGFADQVGDDLRERSRNADARLEHAAWRLLRRRPKTGGGPAPSAAT